MGEPPNEDRKPLVRGEQARRVARLSERSEVRHGEHRVECRLRLAVELNDDASPIAVEPQQLELDELAQARRASELREQSARSLDASPNRLPLRKHQPRLVLDAVERVKHGRDASPARRRIEIELREPGLRPLLGEPRPVDEQYPACSRRVPEPRFSERNRRDRRGQDERLHEHPAACQDAELSHARDETHGGAQPDEP